MKRSQINAAIRAMLDLADRYGFRLPPLAHWTPEDWEAKGCEYDEIRRARLGWDVTDFGKGDFKRFGLTLLTIRNGVLDDPDAKTYCEKLMMAGPGQITPMHFHWQKTEDIINRGGGRLICQLRSADSSEQPTDEPLQVSLDGRSLEVPPGGEVTLEAGESITLKPYQYHAFWAASDGDAVLIGEVSSVNDDTRDNRFLEPLPRFPKIEEDEPPLRLLCTEYPPAKD